MSVFKYPDSKYRHLKSKGSNSYAKQNLGFPKHGHCLFKKVIPLKTHATGLDSISMSGCSNKHPLFILLPFRTFSVVQLLKYSGSTFPMLPFSGNIWITSTPRSVAKKSERDRKHQQIEEEERKSQ